MILIFTISANSVATLISAEAMTLTLELIFHYLPYFFRLSSYHASWYNIQRIVMCNMVSSHVISHGAQLEVPPLWED